MDLERPGMSKDWSFTAWGENGEVEVTVMGKKETEKFPFIQKKD